MKAVLMNEVGRKATIFLSGIETPVRRAMAGKESDPDTEKQVETMKQMAEELDPTGGLNRDWWLKGY
jgi:FAD/FMN-containing dehydrogenase